MKLVGKIVEILPLQQGISKTSGNPWAIQPFVIETQDNFPRKVYFELFGEQRIKDNPITTDIIVQVDFDAESREFNGRWYTTLRAFKVGAPQQKTNVIKPDAEPAQPAEVVAEPESNINFI